MNFKKLGFTSCGIKNISRILLLSFTCSVLLDSATLNGARSKVAAKAKSNLQLAAPVSPTPYQTALAAAMAQRQVMLGKISGPLNSTILAKGNPFAVVPFWVGVGGNGIWPGLQTKINLNKNLTPGDVVGSASSEFLIGYTFSAVYNDFYYHAAAGQLPGSAPYTGQGPDVTALAQTIGDDSKQSMLAALLYFGVNPTADKTEAIWYPATQPLLSFYAPGGTTNPTTGAAIPSPYFTGSTASNLESPGGILIKNPAFCTALNSTYGAGAWSGATCIKDSDCCTDASGNQQACLVNADTAALVPAFEDPVGSGLVTYGMCVTPTASCGQALGASCPSVGTAVGQAGCCVGNNLQCVGSGASALCKSGAGGTCSGNSDCASGLNLSCVSGTCQAPQTCQLFGLNTGCISGSATNDCCKKDASGNPISLTCDTGNCLGNIGYKCTTNQDCATGLACPAGGGQCMQTPTTCPVANIANGATCSQAVGVACCTNFNAGVSCAAGQGTTVASVSPGLACCIDPDNGTAISRDAPCFVQTGATAGYSTDCCSGFTCLDTDNTPVVANASGTCGHYTAPTAANPNPTPTPPAKDMSPYADAVFVIAAIAGIKGFDWLMVKVTKGGTDTNKYTDWYFVKQTGPAGSRQTKGAYVVEKATGVMKWLMANMLDNPAGKAILAAAGIPAEAIDDFVSSYKSLQAAAANAQSTLDGLGLAQPLNPAVEAATVVADARQAAGGYVPPVPPAPIVVPAVNPDTANLYTTYINKLLAVQDKTFANFTTNADLKGDFVNALSLKEMMAATDADLQTDGKVDYDKVTRSIFRSIMEEGTWPATSGPGATYTQDDYIGFIASALKPIDMSPLPAGLDDAFMNNRVTPFISARCLAIATSLNEASDAITYDRMQIYRAFYNNGDETWLDSTGHDLFPSW